jgi:16S rRNA (uracil1498-N3)-methyltransferase
MTAPLFRLDPLPTSELVVLAGDEGRHAALVRRLRVGERIDLTDGHGLVAVGIVEVAGRDELEVRVQERSVVPAPAPRIVVVQALIKGDRSELAVEVLTEIGVDEIIPWQAERCVARWSGANSARRWATTADAAAKQSRRVHWPVVAEPLETTGVAQRLHTADLALVLSEDASVPLASFRPEAAGGEIVLVVGPEGGISPAELGTFTAAGASSARLGPTVLRASTAGAAAAAVLLAATGRW